MSFEARLKELGIELPEAAKPLGSYVPCVRTGNLLFLSGILPLRRCIKLNGFVASGPGFTEQPKVLNAASDLLFEIFGEAGRHARAAVGVYILPLDAPVEIDFVFEVKQ